MTKLKPVNWNDEKCLEILEKVVPPRDDYSGDDPMEVSVPEETLRDLEDEDDDEYYGTLYSWNEGEYLGNKDLEFVDDDTLDEQIKRAYIEQFKNAGYELKPEQIIITIPEKLEESWQRAY